MPEQIRCPSCDAALRVPESLLGSTVKCPKCETTFTAELPPPQSVRRDLPPPDEAPPLRIRKDEADDLGDEDEHYPRRRRRRRRRRGDYGDAEAEVSGPAISLMVSAGLGIAATIAYLIFRLADLALLKQPIPTNQAGQAGFAFGVAGVIGGALLGILMCFITLAGAIKMKRLQNHGLAVTACVLAMLPCNCCCMLGLPFGIWGLVVLNKPDVKNAFS
jgi:predicted Zn finger-like uncharacterized protein